MPHSSFAMAVRQVFAHKTFSAINLGGLALGMASATLIGLFIQHELSYDRHYAESDRIIRISEDVASVDGSRGLHFAGTAPIMAIAVKDYFPGIERTARISTCGNRIGGLVVLVGDQSYHEPNFAAADNDLFEIFDFEWLAGDPRSALVDPRGAVLTESAARRYFADPTPLGRTFMLEGIDGPFEVKGVIRDLPDNTHLRLDLLMSLQFLPPQQLESWGDNCYHTYALLRAGESVGEIQRRSAQFFDDKFSAGSSQFRDFTAIPVTQIHLRSSREGELKTPGSMTTVFSFAAIALFVLLVATANFVNLATARAAQRAKEVGIRRSIGGTRRRLIRQFIGESLLSAVVAAALALALVAVALPPFARFVEKDIGLADLASSDVASLLALVTVTVGLLGGSYPAFVLSAFDPVRVLRGEVISGNSAARVRKSLVVLQFAISIALVVATLVVDEQTRFARAFELGYDKDQIVVLSRVARGLGPEWQSMKQRLLALPEVRAATASAVTPGTRCYIRAQVKPLGADGAGFIATLIPVDFDFFETYEIDVRAGRSFAEGRGDREVIAEPNPLSPPPQAVVLSELAVERLGWTPEEAIGRTFALGGGASVLIGVVQDAHLESVRDPLVPVAYIVPPVQSSALREASIRVSGRNLESTLRDIDGIWRELVTDQPVMRRFLDDDIDALYRREQRQTQVLSAFSALAIAIACLGLFGLASFATVRRTKEIGVRKILGASVTAIVRLFTQEFALLAVIANVIAWPLAYIAMQRWLEGFAYRIALDAWVFVAAAGSTLALAVVTVGLVSAKAARTKPAAALRHE